MSYFIDLSAMGRVYSFHVCIIPHRYVIDVFTVSRKSIIGFTSLTMVNLKYQFDAIKWPSYRYSVSFLLLTSKWFMPCSIFRALHYSIHLIAVQTASNSSYLILYTYVHQLISLSTCSRYVSILLSWIRIIMESRF